MLGDKRWTSFITALPFTRSSSLTIKTTFNRAAAELATRGDPVRANANTALARVAVAPVKTTSPTARVNTSVSFGVSLLMACVESRETPSQVALAA